MGKYDVHKILDKIKDECRIECGKSQKARAPNPPLIRLSSLLMLGGGWCLMLDRGLVRLSKVKKRHNIISKFGLLVKGRTLNWRSDPHPPWKGYEVDCINSPK